MKPPKVDPASAQRRWSEEIRLAKAYFNPWRERGEKVERRYADRRSDEAEGVEDAAHSRFNILWSNVQTLRPALYAKRPIPEVVRRFKDADPVGRAAAEILERAVTFAVDDTTYSETMTACVMDRLLPGRGTAWVRYCPYYGDEVTPRLSVSMEPGEDGSPMYRDEDGGDVEPAMVQTDPKDGSLFVTGEPYTPVEWEDVEPDYVNWKDFLHSPAPTWPRVRWVAKRVRMSRAQLVKRFGEKIAKDIPLNSRDQGCDDKSIEIDRERFGRADIYEIWDKDSRKAIWLSLDYSESLLDEKDDPLRLKGFFPCPRPIMATTTTDSLIPIPDFIYYQDQARQLDEITLRVDLLTKALRVAGAYDASSPELVRLLSDEGENTLVPVENWAAFGEKGGIAGAISFLPIADIVATLQTLVQVREQIKQDLYEITGLSDIIRGQSQAAETATAQRLKGQYATLRLSDLKDDVQRFARDLIALMAEVMAEHFSPETLLEMSGYQGMTGADPSTFVKAVAMLRDEKLRSFRIDIETDSTIQADEEAEKAARTQFLEASTAFLEKAIPAAQALPEAAPMLFEMLMFGVRAFKAGRQLEGAFEEFQQRMAAKAGQPQPPSPEQQKAEMEGQKIQAEIQLKQMDLQIKQAELQIRQAEAGMEQQREQAKADAAMQNAGMKAQNDIRIAETKAVADITIGREKANADMAIQAQKANQDAALRAQQASQDAVIKREQAAVNAEIAAQRAAQQPKGKPNGA